MSDVRIVARREARESKLTMNIGQFEQDAIIDRLEGWELVEFLQVSTEQALVAAIDNDWINEENFADLLDFIGLKD